MPFACFLQPSSRGHTSDKLFFGAIMQRRNAFDPFQSAAKLALRTHRFTETAFVHEISEINSNGWIKSAVVRQFGRRAGRTEVAQRVTHALSVAPEPVQLVFVRGHNHGVLTHDLPVKVRMFYRGSPAQQFTVAIDSRASNSIETFGDLRPSKFDFCTVAGFATQFDAAVFKEIFRIFVTWALNMKVNLLAHQSGLIESDQPSAV